MPSTVSAVFGHRPSLLIVGYALFIWISAVQAFVQKQLGSLCKLPLPSAKTNKPQPINGDKASIRRYVSGMGWDNDNFLESLGQGAQEQAAANEEYRRMSNYQPAVQIQDLDNEAWPDFGDNGAPNGDHARQAMPWQWQQQQQSSQNLNAYGQPQHPSQPYQQQQVPYNPQYSNPSFQQPQGGPQPNQVQGSFNQQYAPPQPPPQQQGTFHSHYGQSQQPQQQQAFTPQYGESPQQQQQQQQFQQPPTSGFQPLARDSGAIDVDVNEEDRVHPPDLEGAQKIPKEVVENVKASHTPEEEASQGGEMFRNLMARAKQQVPRIPTPPLQYYPPQQQQQQSINGVSIPAGAMDLSIEEQARLYRELVAQRQQQQYHQPSGSYAQQQMPRYPYGSQAAAPQYLPPGTGYDGRKIGRNQDADMISTAADVYLAQLKRDSTTRRIARDAGDIETSNSVFHDPTIKDIAAPVNPYLEEQRAKERDMLETVPEEMLIFQEYDEEEGSGANLPTTNGGPSYRQKLEQYRQKRKGNNSWDG